MKNLNESSHFREVEKVNVFRCARCGKIYQSLPAPHGHAEEHTGFLSFGNFEDLMQYTEKLKVTEYEELDAPEDQPFRGENPE